MVIQPLMLADVKQDGEHAPSLRGAGIEVVRKHLVELLAAVMNNNLLSIKMGMTEGRGATLL